MRNLTYTSQLEIIKSNALRDIEAYMTDKKYTLLQTKTNTIFWSSQSNTLCATAGLSGKPLVDFKCDELAYMADYINSINDK